MANFTKEEVKQSLQFLDLKKQLQGRALLFHDAYTEWAEKLSYKGYPRYIYYRYSDNTNDDYDKYDDNDLLEKSANRNTILTFALSRVLYCIQQDTSGFIKEHLKNTTDKEAYYFLQRFQNASNHSVQYDQAALLPTSSDSAVLKKALKGMTFRRRADEQTRLAVGAKDLGYFDLHINQAWLSQLLDYTEKPNAGDKHKNHIYHLNSRRISEVTYLNQYDHFSYPEKECLYEKIYYTGLNLWLMYAVILIDTVEHFLQTAEGKILYGANGTDYSQFGKKVTAQPTPRRKNRPHMTSDNNSHAVYGIPESATAVQNVAIDAIENRGVSGHYFAPPSAMTSNQNLAQPPITTGHYGATHGSSRTEVSTKHKPCLLNAGKYIQVPKQPMNNELFTLSFDKLKIDLKLAPNEQIQWLEYFVVNSFADEWELLPTDEDVLGEAVSGFAAVKLFYATDHADDTVDRERRSQQLQTAIKNGVYRIAAQRHYDGAFVVIAIDSE